MLPQSLPPFLVFVLAATSIGGVLLAVFFPRAARLSPYRRRFAALAAPDAHPRDARGADDDQDRRRTV
ncbi:MAG TPA: pilus assembly protein, partial [Rhizobium sp.]|nr:pilus assembly protein [Rhizobium sp.]